MMDLNRLSLSLPAALVTFWGAGREPSIQRFRDSAPGTWREGEGVHWLSAHQCAVMVEAGDPAVFDAAVSLASAVLDASRGDGAQPERLQVLINPCRVQVTDGTATRIDEPLIQDLKQRPPLCAEGVITLTSISTVMLETPRALREAGIYEGPSGRLVPLFHVGSEEIGAAPWRNPAVLRSSRPYVSRPILEAQLRDFLVGDDGRLLRIEGPLGSGKTRLTWETLRRLHGAPPLWATARADRHGGPTLVSQWLAQLLRDQPALSLDGPARLTAVAPEEVDRLLTPYQQPSRLLDPETAAQVLATALNEASADGDSAGPGQKPALLVADGLEAATTRDWATLRHLAALVGDTADFRLVLVARSGTTWHQSWKDVLQWTIPAMEPVAMAKLSQGLFSGLSLPEPVEERYLAAAAGNPFTLEEGLAGLIPLKLLRQVYGSFFFNGSDDTGFSPSPRLLRHAEAEARRFGKIDTLRRLAVADTPIPEFGLLVPSEDPSEDGSEDTGAWLQAMIDLGWLQKADSPWGPGVEFACPAHGLALAGALSPEDRSILRRELGERLWAAETNPDQTGAWAIYRLLGEAPAAIEPLLAAAQDANSKIPPEELLARLRTALERLRAQPVGATAKATEGGGGGPTELEVLWYLLPLARRLGVLQDFADDVDRARELAQGDPKRLLAFASLKAELEERKGHLVEAIRTIRAALQDARQGQPGSHRVSEAVLVLQLARLLIRREQLDDARELLEELSEALEQKGAHSMVASCRFYLGNVAIHQERFEDALDLHRSALAERRTLGAPKAIGTSLSALGTLAIEMGRYMEALTAFREAEEIFSQLGDEDEASFALLGIGKALSRIGDYSAATGPVRRALVLREQVGGDAVGQAIARMAVAKNYLHLEQAAEALREARHALFDLTLLTDATPRADAEQLVGCILLSQRQWDRAVDHLNAALEGHRKASASRDVALDLCYLMEATMAGQDHETLAVLVKDLAEATAACANSERRELLELRLYKGLSRLADHNLAQRRLALPHLERAYGGLMEKTQHLPREDRHRFLFQVPDHEAIVTAATAKGLAIPGTSSEPVPTTNPTIRDAAIKGATAQTTVAGKQQTSQPALHQPDHELDVNPLDTDSRDTDAEPVTRPMQTLPR